MKNIEKIKERVIKLLELAANNKSESETLNALTKARELIGRYKLNEAELKGSVKKGIEPTRELVNLNFKKKYMLNLADLISRHFPEEYKFKEKVQLDSWNGLSIPSVGMIDTHTSFTKKELKDWR